MTPHLICHDVLQCSQFSKLQRKCRLHDGDSALKSFIHGMEGFTNLPVTLLCLSEGIIHPGWVEYVKSNLSAWSIQCHGWSHYHYKRLSEKRLLDDLKSSKAALEETFGVEVTHYYPPFRQFRPKDRQLASGAGLILDGRHHHPYTELNRWESSNRIDFHYWYWKDVLMTRAILDARSSSFTFVLGAPRSGTTAYMRYLHSQTPGSKMLKEIESIWPLSDRKVRLHHMSRLSDCSALIDKNVRNTFRILRIQRLFPTAQFTFLYRYPYAAISSWRDWACKTRKEDTSIEGAAQQYKHYVRYWLENRGKLNRYNEVRYEDLCATLPYFKSRNNKWKRRLSASEVSTIDRILGPLSGEIGY